MPPKYVGQQLPVVGPWIGKFGRVADMMATPCEPTPGIWVLAGFAGLPTALFTLFKPDPFDAQTQRFGLGHKKRGGRKFRFGEIVTAPKPSRGGLQWVFFKVGSWAERVGWYFLIVDVAFEWAFNWTSMAYMWSGCKDPNGSWGYVDVNSPLVGINDAFYAGWSGTDHNGDISTDDFSVFATKTMTCSPYLELEIGAPALGASMPKMLEFQLVDLNSGWAAPPIIPTPDWGSKGYKQSEVYRDYLGLGSKPRYALHIKSDSGFWSMKCKMGLNGVEGRQATFDP